MPMERERPQQPVEQEINLEAEQINLNTDQIEAINTAIQAACEGIQVDAAAIEIINTAIQAAVEAILTKMTDKLQMVQVTDGTNQAAVIAAILSLKSDLSSVAGTVTTVGDGAVGAGTQRVTLANDDVLQLAARDALQTLDNIVVVSGATASTSGAQLMALAKDLLPAAVAEGQAVRFLSDLFGQIYIKGYVRSDGTLGTSVQSTPRGPEPLIADDWAALAAAGDETPVRDTRDYDNHTFTYDITIGTLTSMDLIIWGSVDNVLWVPLATIRVLAAGVLTDSVKFSGTQINWVKCELEAENGAADGSVVFQYTGK